MSKVHRKGKIFMVISILLIIRKIFKWIPELRSIYYYWGDYFSILLFTWIVMALFLCNIFIKKKWLAVCISIYFCIAAGLDAFMKIGDIMCLFDDYVGLDFMINLIFAIMSCIYISCTDANTKSEPKEQNERRIIIYESN